MTALSDARDIGNRARRLGAPGPPARLGANAVRAGRALEAQLRDDFGGHGDEWVFLETEDGEIARRTAAEIFDDLDKDDGLLREFRECIL